MSITKSTIVVYEYSGSTNELTIPFDYLKRDFVIVALGGDGKPQKALRLGTDYRFATKTTIVVTRQYQPEEGYNKIIIRRVTDASKRIINYQDGSILNASELNTSQLQALHVAEEARDLANYTLFVDDNNNLDARGRKIINLGDPTNPQDAVTKKYVDTASESVIDSRNKALKYRNEAEGFRNEAEQFKNDANNSKQVATSKAAEISSKIEKADQLNTQAISNSNKAQQYATSAQQSATAASLAEKNAKASDKSAATSAENAKNYADSVNPSLLINTVETIEALKALKGATNGIIKYVKQYDSNSKLGGGSFIFDTSISKDDGVVNFQGIGGTWKRLESQTILAEYGGCSPDISPELNDIAFARVFAYCKANKKDLKIKGIHRINSTLDTTGIDGIRGDCRDTDGFEMPDSVGKTLLIWGRKTILEHLLIKGSGSRASNDGSIGIKGAPYACYANDIRMTGWSIAVHYHTSVDCHFKRMWIINCRVGMLLDGYLNENLPSTTGSISDSEFHTCYDGVVVGGKGGFGTAVTGFVFHNVIFEQNSHIGIVATKSKELDGTSYNCLDFRNVTFSGSTWFEINKRYAYDLSRAFNVVCNGAIRAEGGDVFLDPEHGSITKMDGRAIYIGGNNVRINKELRTDYIDVVNTEWKLKGNAYHRFSLYSDKAKSESIGGFKFRQAISPDVSRNTTEFAIDLKSEHEAQASTKLVLGRSGNLKITGAYAPFTGVHLFYSKSDLEVGKAVKGVDFTKRLVGDIAVDGECALTDTEFDSSVLGIVDSSQLDPSTGLYVIYVAATGDCSTSNIEGIEVDGEFEVGDYLGTSDKIGMVKVYGGTDMRKVFLQVKGKRGNLAYCYFK